MTKEHLYNIYSRWTGDLHFLMVKELDLHLDCEYLPDQYEFKVYSGFAEEFSTTSGIPGLSRPRYEDSETIKLLRPEDNPSQEQLDYLFKTICLAAARVLGIKIRRKGLGNGQGSIEGVDEPKRMGSSHSDSGLLLPPGDDLPG
jgi:hypothetical protein